MNPYEEQTSLHHCQMVPLKFNTLLLQENLLFMTSVPDSLKMLVPTYMAVGINQLESMVS